MSAENWERLPLLKSEAEGLARTLGHTPSVWGSNPKFTWPVAFNHCVCCDATLIVDVYRKPGKEIVGSAITRPCPHPFTAPPAPVTEAELVAAGYDVEPPDPG